MTKVLCADKRALKVCQCFCRGNFRHKGLGFLNTHIDHYIAKMLASLSHQLYLAVIMTKMNTNRVDIQSARILPFKGLRA